MTSFVDTARLYPSRARRLVAAAGEAWRARRAPAAVEQRRRLRMHRAHLRAVRRHEWWTRQAARWGRARRPLFTAGGFAAFIIGAWQLHMVAGLFMLGVSLWMYDWLARPQAAR